jgi:DNA-3-methyladenine glycosylase
MDLGLTTRPAPADTICNVTDLRALLSRASTQVAPELLGWRLSRTTTDGTVTVSLSEVEAYAGVDDPASHAYRGRTARTGVMFGPAGHLYVYFTYGMHWCCNVVTGSEGEASAVLLRAGRVIEGMDLARTRRGPKVSPHALARGPATLTQALGITGADDGTDLLSAGSIHLLPPPGALPHPAVSCGPRVGVSRAPDVAWRFWLTGDDTVSAYKRSPRAAD